MLLSKGKSLITMHHYATKQGRVKESYYNKPLWYKARLRVLLQQTTILHSKFKSLITTNHYATKQG